MAGMSMIRLDSSSQLEDKARGHMQHRVHKRVVIHAQSAAYVLLGSWLSFRAADQRPHTFVMSCSRSRAAGTNAGLPGALVRG